MDMNGRKYIAYGSNLNREQMAQRCPDAKVIGSGVIRDYELLFRGHRDAAFATVEPKEGENVPVLIWEISPRDEVNLDRYEGYPRLYGKQMLEVEVEGGCEKMMAYIMKDGPAMEIPSGRYLKTIQTGYKEAGFDESVLANSVRKSIDQVLQKLEENSMGEEECGQQQL